METTNVQVRSLFGSEVQYIIPIFQRHYVWDQEEQWEPLWEDIKIKTHQRLSESEIQWSPHFTGAIVIQQMKTNVDEVRKYEIIDGQQRLTTFQIIFCALRDVCKSLQFDRIKADAVRHIRNQGSLLNDLNDEQYKLIPTQYDKASFISLVDNHVDECSGQIRSTYDYFKYEIEDYVNSDEDNMLTLWRTLLNDFDFVQIRIDENDQPQRIFESLNARAKPLLQFDLLRNSLFLRARIEEDIDQLYSDYWMDFENDYWEKDVVVGREKIKLSEIFLQHFLMAKLGEERITPLFQVYERRLARDSGVKHEFSGLKEYAKTYREMIDCSPNSEIGRSMSFYKTFEITTLHPFLLFIKNELKVSDSDLKQILHILESYTMRRLLCFRGGTRNYTQLVSRLIQGLKGKRFELGDFTSLLSNESSDATRWPTDSDIQTYLETGWYDYKISRNIIRYILYQIELVKRQENQFLETSQLIFDNKLSLEHIMPEAWKETWCLPLANDGESSSNDQIYYEDLFSLEYKDSAQNWETEPSEEGLEDKSYQYPFQLAQERNIYLQSIGNLTIITRKLNSKLSNSPFTKKREALQENSDLRLNREICVHDSWDTEQIQDRANELFTIFCKIWPSSEEFAEDVPPRLDPPVHIPQPDESSSIDLHHDEITGGPSPAGLLRAGVVRRQRYPLTVTIPDRNLQICCPKAIDTLIEVIKALGIENVRSLGIMSPPIPLVAIKYYGYNQKKMDGYYVAGNSPTVTKAEQIKVIGDKLNIQLKVVQRNVQ